MTATKPLPPHGTTARYFTHDCRCDACKAKSTAYHGNRRRQIAYGRWDPWTDAAPVRKHLAWLAANDIGTYQAAKLAGVARSTVSALTWGRDGRTVDRVRRSTAAAILAVKPLPDLVADHAFIDSVGTVRRIQSLAAAGFPLGWQAARLGRAPSNLSKTMRRDTVEAATARAVADMYDELHAMDPAGFRIGAGESARTRRYAAKKGWILPDRWEGEIDNPDADPSAWARKETAGHVTNELLEDAEFIMRTTGSSFRAVAGRLGVSRTALEKARERAKAGAA